VVPELAKALGMLSAEKFGKVIALLRRPVGRRVRTNNQGERMNRRLRYGEKVRYQGRQRRSLVRFVVLALAAQGAEKVRAPAGTAGSVLGPPEESTAETGNGPPTRRAA
jgi:hypothetical protein